MSHGTAYPAIATSSSRRAVPGTSDATSVRPCDPTQVWAALVPAIAARPRVRVSRDQGRSYPRRWERALTEHLPTRPAAVPLYDGAGRTCCLVIDLDVSRGGPEVVVADCGRLVVLIGRCGGRVIVDESPTGGRHLYLPLAEPVDFLAARDMAVDLAAITPSMDPSPNYGLTDGVIRPPGSPHRSGGHQQLLTGLAEAVDIATRRNPGSVWARLRAAVPHVPAAPVDQVSPGAGQAPLPRSGGPAALSSRMLAIAVQGRYDPATYPTPSHARQAVIVAAAAAGLTLLDVLGRVHRGVWPGLAALYARYAPRHRTGRIRADWANAVTYLRKPSPGPGQEHVRNSPTSALSSHRGVQLADKTQHGRGSAEEYRWLRSWQTGVKLCQPRWVGKDALGIRRVLRALGAAAMATGSRYVAFGVRSLSVEAGLDHTTVAAHLRRLRDEDDPLIDLIESDRGLAGDLYSLRMPEAVATRAERRPWPPGKVHGMRPVFRQLGAGAAELYELLARAPEPLTSFQITNEAGLPRSTVYEALQTLAAHDLANQGRRGWTVGHADPALLAEAWGITQNIEHIIARHRAERAAYRRALRIYDDPYTDLLDPRWSPAHHHADHPARGTPEDLLATAIDLLQRTLGAQPIAASG